MNDEETGIRYALHLPGEIASLPKAQETMTAWAGQCGFAEDRSFQWQLVLSEALTNAVRHGSPRGSESRVGIHFDVMPGEQVLSVHQEGPGPDVRATPQARLPDDPLSEGGRGRYIIESFADRVEHWEGPCGYVVKIRKSSPGEMPPLSTEMNETLSELSASYESLTAYNRLGEQLLHHESLGDFFASTFEDLRLGHPFRSIRVYPGADMPDSVGRAFSGQAFFHEGDRLPWEGKAERSFWHPETEVPAFLRNAAKGVRHGLVAPVYVDERHFFDILVEFASGEAMSSPEVNFLTGIADLLGMAAGIHDLQRQREKAARREREWEIATQLQRNLLPIEEKVRAAPLRFALFRESAGEVAGDHALVCRPRGPEGSTYFLLLDVMGKGVRAAMLAILFRGVFTTLAAEEPSPEEVLNRLNRMYCQMLGETVYFVTAAVCRLAPGEDCFEIANAGHCDVFAAGREGALRVGASGPPLGIVAGSNYSGERWPLEDVRRIFLYSDGCYEWDFEGDLFGVERLWDLFLDMAGAPQEEVWRRLREKMRSSAPASALKPPDDITLLLCDPIAP